jgi:S1-C subfamily serine protease
LVLITCISNIFQVGGIVDQLIQFGKVTRPILGIKFAPDQSVEQLGLSGVLVLDAPPNGPAGKAVLSIDIIHMVSGNFMKLNWKPLIFLQ